MPDVLDATELARQVREGEVTATELVERHLGYLEQVDSQLHAVVLSMAASAREAAAALDARDADERAAGAPFAGVPIVVKDLDGYVKDVPYTGSSRFLEHYVPTHDSPVIARLRAMGFLFLAKVNCPELGILGTTEPAWRGPTHNPWNLEHSPGGSSGGSAAVVAARAVPLAHGGDGGGSLRIPASACGLVGLKPSRGRVPVEGGEGWGGFVQQGVMTHTVRDTARVLDGLAGPQPGMPYHAPPLRRPLVEELDAEVEPLRVGWTTRSIYGKETHPDCVAAVKTAVARLEDLGHEVEEVELPIDRSALSRAYLVQVAASTAADIARYERLLGRRSRSSDWEPVTWFLKQLGGKLPAQQLQEARDAALEASRAMGAFHQTTDLLLTPTLAHPPVRLGQLALKSHERIGLGVLRAVPVRAVLESTLDALAADSLEQTPNTQLFNQTGQPGISLPLHIGAQGLPIGVQLVSAYGREDLLVRVSAQLERQQGWLDQRPAVCVP